MGLKLYEEGSIQNIANAIRAKGVSGSFTVGEMASAVSRISSGSSPSGTLSISSNGLYNVSSYAYVDVSIDSDYYYVVNTVSKSAIYGGTQAQVNAWLAVNVTTQHAYTQEWFYGNVVGVRPN